MTVLFLIVALGFIAAKIRLFPRIFAKRLSALVINITLPALIFSSVSDSSHLPDPSAILPLLLLSTGSYVFLSLIAGLLTHALPFPRKEEGIYRFMLIFGNVGFIGYPVVCSIFGQEAIFYACVLNMPNALFVFTLGSYLITKGKNSGSNPFRIWDILSPSMLASILSILLVFLKWEMPSILGDTFKSLGGITVPASLMIIGSSMARIHPREMPGSPPLYMVVALHLILLPYLLNVICRMLPVDAELVHINTIVMGMPVASFGTLFCLQYGVDDKSMTQGTFLSTLLSTASIPLLASLIL